MTRILAAWVAMAAWSASFQDKDEQKKLDDEAKAALSEYKEKRKKAREEPAFIDSLQPLKQAKPHRLVRTELTRLLDQKLPYSIRTEVASILAAYKKDSIAADALVRRARAERGPDATDFRRRCLRSFGDIAPFAKSVELLNLFSDPDNAVAREAVEAAETIRSVRMLAPLTALYGELDRIREDDAPDQGPGVPGAGGPPAGDKDTKRKRKEALLDPVKKALNALWSKIDSKKSVMNLTEANRALQGGRSDIKRIQEEEDQQDEKAKTP